MKKLFLFVFFLAAPALYAQGPLILPPSAGWPIVFTGAVFNASATYTTNAPTSPDNDSLTGVGITSVPSNAGIYPGGSIL